MEELISPSQSDAGVLVAALVVAVVAAVWGLRVFGMRGVVAGVLGPLIWGLWQCHKWITRYESQSGYFGLDKVKVLLLEIVLFVALGAVLGIVYQKLKFTTEVTENTEK